MIQYDIFLFIGLIRTRNVSYKDQIEQVIWSSQSIMSSDGLSGLPSSSVVSTGRFLSCYSCSWRAAISTATIAKQCAYSLSFASTAACESMGRRLFSTQCHIACLPLLIMPLCGTSKHNSMLSSNWDDCKVKIQ